ncbi:MAG: competence protein ComJ [Myxococcaceae bacterium]
MSISVSYTQLAVFDPSLENPFNEWRKEHVAQGFSWRDGSVSFATLDDGPVDVEVQLSPRSAELLEVTVRAIRVPFRVPEAGRIEIASIADGREVAMPAGDYALTYEHGRTDDGRMWSRLTFVPERPVPFAVLRADSELTPQDPLTTYANPAV